MTTADLRSAAASANPHIEPWEWSITLPYPPSVNAMYATYRGRRILSAEGRAFKRNVAIRAIRCPMFRGPVIFHMDLYRPLKRGDLSNRIKICEDALIGVSIIDDAQVTEIHARRHDDKENPRVEIRITRAERISD